MSAYNQKSTPAAVRRRILAELKEFNTNPLDECVAAPIEEDNIFDWTGTIYGPQDTPYANGVFNLTIEFPTNYPFGPPDIKFTTPVYHPNIDEDGYICLNILTKEWCPALIISKTLLSICAFLTSPDVEDPLIPAIADQYKTNRKEFDLTVEQWVKIFASGNNEPASNSA